MQTKKNRTVENPSSTECWFRGRLLNISFNKEEILSGKIHYRCPTCWGYEFLMHVSPAPYHCTTCRGRVKGYAMIVVCKSCLEYCNGIRLCTKYILWEYVSIDRIPPDFVTRNNQEFRWLEKQWYNIGDIESLKGEQSKPSPN